MTATTPVTFLHLTDLHLTAPNGEGPDSERETSKRLRAVLAQAQAFDPRPAFIVMSGDLADIGDEQSYRLLDACLAETELPVMLTLGNHDKREPFRAVFADRFDGIEGADGQAPVCQDRLIAGLHVIAVDTKVPGRIGGALSPAALDFLDDALARHPRSPKVLAIHHPPKRRQESRDHWDSLTAESTAALAERLERHRVEMILSGHVHLDQATNWQGALLVTNTGLLNSIDLTRRDMLHIVEGAGYGICSWQETGTSVAFASMHPERALLRQESWERLRNA